MNEADIRKYAALMKELELTGLEITEDNKVVRLERTQPSATCEQVVIQAPSSASPTPAQVPANNNTADGSIVVKSPIVGVFYAAPAENAEPFVSIGDRVEKGQTLCIIEAMKLMNEITAEQSGVIEKICVTNGQVVEFGTELFRIGR
ncbi:MAG: acetyl-CoA carboxylase biotin carboxyl carrier protein [Clostridia bacterium]|nr:acetyl-CoA carboxylase biotin carboxyl carrier protein [Clostridia bacterium]